jgi:hypothetical protein
MNEEDPPDLPTTADTQGLAPRTPVKEKKTAEELAMMIHQDLSKVEGCPKRGVNVTVYGFDPWNAMLMFGVEAGPVPNKKELLAFFDIIIERLKRLYDVRDSSERP